MSKATEQRGRLEILLDPAFQRREWVIQRIAWVLMGVILLAALLGLFGDGPLSHASARSPDGRIRVAYERFLRNHAPGEFSVFVEPGAVDADGRVRVWLARDYLESVRLKEVVPAPEAVAVAPERTLWTFHVPHGPAT